jgi:DNA-binding PadR family transcriptional regulator
MTMKRKREIDPGSSTGDDFQPLKRHWFHILLALSEEDRHGSGIVRAVLEHTDGKLRLWPAILYGSLDELSARGWIEELPDPERPNGASQRKRFYRLTPAGIRALRTEARQLATLAKTALDRVSAGARSR